MNAVQIIDYERKYREDLLSLMFYSRRTHVHLDWYKVGNWLDYGDSDVLLAYQDAQLLGFIGVSHPLNRTCWMRLAAVQQGCDAAMVLGTIWETLGARLYAGGVESVSILVINAWLGRYLPALGFQYLEDVVTLHRSSTQVPQIRPHPFDIRNGYIEDLAEIVRVDHTAFNPPWQMSKADLRHSQRQAASCTVAEYEGQIIGYQISTRQHTSGHLARLGVLPQVQGHGVGKVILKHLIRNFTRRGVHSITVNTQQSNIRSQRLYQRFGFLRNGFDLAVWHCRL